jgi:hypothetical protein
MLAVYLPAAVPGGTEKLTVHVCGMSVPEGQMREDVLVETQLAGIGFVPVPTTSREAGGSRVERG